MDVVRPEFVPDASLSREEMEQLQRDIAAAAMFDDDLSVDPAGLCVDDAIQTSFAAFEDGYTAPESRERDGDTDGEGENEAEGAEPLVAGVDQAFVDDQAVSVVVVLRDGEVVERVSAVAPTEIPYIPGLLSFREGGAILAAFEALECEPDLALVDGSGRIHFREAGLATHIGVTLDLPAIGVAKKLLCGTPRESLDRKLPTGARVAIEADADVTAPDGTVIGYAVQTRQFENSDRYVNPLYVSPGHRVSAETAADVVSQCGGGYKLPEPTRLADSYADQVKRRVAE